MLIGKYTAIRYVKSKLHTIQYCMSAMLVVALISNLVVVPEAIAQTTWSTPQTIGCPGGFDTAVVPAPILPLKSLKTVPNPVFPNGIAGAPRADIAQFVANQTAAIQLGKALFWDIQVGSDNKTACASCHFQAGADVRAKNQMHPGYNFPTSGTFYGTNYKLSKTDFPFTSLSTDKTDNSAGSQGVRASTFVDVNGVTGDEFSNPVTDPIFANSRQSTSLNTPSVVNAVFNHRNFFNGRAQTDFNGVNPFGSRDINAQIWYVNSVNQIAPQTIRLDLASLASQAVGPPTSSVEMSAAGRSFADIGRKMLKLKPLGLQAVDARDSVLGKLAETKIKGLKTTYAAMIQAAFQSQYWNNPGIISLPKGNYSLMEANFSLYWGISLMLYEATLVSDDSPMDQFLDTRLFDAAGFLKKEGSSTKLAAVAKRLAADYQYGTAAFPSAMPDTVSGILNGLRLFEKPLIPAAPPTGRQCIECHLGAATTGASVASVTGAGGAEPADVALKNAGFDLRMERIFEQIPSVPTDLVGVANNKPAYFTDQVNFDPTSTAITSIERVDVNLTTGAQTKTAVSIPAPIAVYDTGWYNLGVRPSSEDPGVGGTDPFGSPLAWVQYLPLVANASNFKIPGGTLGCATPTYNPGPTPPVLRDALGNPLFPNVVLNAQGYPLLSGPLRNGESTDSTGSFKTSSLRNVELNGPYFHNGSKATLKQVINFYNLGGDFPKAADGRGQNFPIDRRAPTMKFYEFLAMHPSGLGLMPGEINDLVAFLLSLTDDRVRLEKAPFDHPEITIPAGESAPGIDATLVIPAVGAAGRATPIQPFLGINPFEP